MEQQTATETKVAAKVAAIKRTIPNKQKSAIKLVMWALSQVMEKEAMIAKIVEMFKVTETIETIIETVDAVEKSPEYTTMDTELAAIRNPKTKKRAKVSGDPDAIIKQLVDMATMETTAGATGKKKGKAPKVEGEEKPKKAPRGKKVDDSTEPTTDAPAATAVETEPKKKAPRAKKAKPTTEAPAEAPAEAPTTEAPTVVVETEPKKKAPRAKKAATAPPAAAEPTTEETPPAAADDEAKANAAPKAPKKAPAKKTKTTVESNGTTPAESTESAPKKSKTKKATADGEAPKAPPSNIVEPNPYEAAEDLREDEYMLLNEVVVDGKTYMVDSNQDVYNDFNEVVGKYENGVVTMKA
jgi:hypothetical protein